jgi:hypothetical protein
MSKNTNKTTFIVSITKHNIVATDGWKGSTSSQVWFDAINYDDARRIFPLKENETIDSIKKSK